jgi:thiamine transport system substrate-binding protein
MNRLSALALLTLVVAACSTPGPAPATASGPTAIPAPVSTNPPATATAAPSGTIGGSVTLVTHDSFAASDDVIADFEKESGAKLNVLKGGDAGTVVNQAILTRSNPLGDVLYGVDNTFLSRALDAGIFAPYVSPASESVDPTLLLDPRNRVTPIDYGDVCINYDRSAYSDGSAAPSTIADLTRPAFRNQLVVENPATSSPGLAFVLSTILRFGESGAYTWLDYWKDLRANGALVVADWNSAYYSEFSGGAGEGDRPLVVSYATSPAAEVYFADPQPTESPTANVDDACFRQIEFAGVLAGSNNPAGAQAWIDYMASPEFQSDMPLNMFVFPVNPDAQVPELFTTFPAKASTPLTMDPLEIAANRDKWIQEWTDAVLH